VVHRQQASTPTTTSSRTTRAQQPVVLGNGRRGISGSGQPLTYADA
jgi:hypothetical protein